MFDARSLLEQLVRNSGQPQRAAGAQPGGPGGLGDILGQLGQAMGQQGAAGGSGTGGGGLADILGRLGEAMGQPGRQAGSASTSQSGGSGGLQDIMKDVLPKGEDGGSHQQSQPAGGAAGGSLSDILSRIQEGLGQQGGGSAGTQGGAGGGLIDVLGQILGQATQGVREGAGRIDDATGASGHVRDAVGQATGMSPDELMARVKELINSNQLGAGAVLGGLGAILLGTRTGRSLTTGAAKLGALAMIGGLAYKALQNYQQGRPVLSGATPSQFATAPSGSGFEPDAVTHDAAQLYIRGMIAAAAADGRIDEGEQMKIIGGLKQAGLEAGAEEFLARELNNPATIDDLVQSVHSEAEAVQLYTAARLAIDLDTAEEHEFLVALARGLGIDETLASHIDAQARAAA
jgi:uncharacterized membrane protein YebE (DUF533 family)